MGFKFNKEELSGPKPVPPGLYTVKFEQFRPKKSKAGDSINFNAEDPTTWKYAGPIVGKTAQWEVGIKTYQGRDSNEPRQFICAIKGDKGECASLYPQIRHARDMASKD